MQQPRMNKRLLIGGAVFLALTCLIFFTAGERTRQSLPERIVHGAAAPLQKLVSGATGFGADTVRTISELGRLHSENEALRTQVKQLEEQKSELEFYRRENVRLRAALGFKERRPLDMLPVEVIGYNPGDWLSTITIDKGSADGLKRNMPVVSRRGVVGRLSVVRTATSDVLLVNDPRSPMGGVVERTRELVRVIGRADGLCTVTPYSRDTHLRVGDRIVTWNGSENFPPGLVVGTVIRVERDNFGVTSQGVLRMSVELSRLEDAYVVKWVKPAAGQPPQGGGGN